MLCSFQTLFRHKIAQFRGQFSKIAQFRGQFSKIAQFRGQFSKNVLRNLHGAAGNRKKTLKKGTTTSGGKSDFLKRGGGE